jgi:hypothetical protein
MQRNWKHQAWRWLVYTVVSFFLAISIFGHFGYTADPPPEIGEIKEITVKESMSACNKAYEKEVTGTPDGKGYAVGVPKVGRSSRKVKFDGYDESTGTLKDAKGPGYKVLKDGTWSDTDGGRKMRTKLERQARRQENAVLGAEAKLGKTLTIEWILSDEKYLDAFQTVLDNADLKKIKLRYQPPSETVKNLCKKKKSSSDDSSH